MYVCMYVQFLDIWINGINCQITYNATSYKLEYIKHSIQYQ